MDQIPEGAIPIDQFQAAEETPPPGAIPIDQFQSQEQAYGSAGQGAKAAVEGIAKGVLGPIAPWAEQRYLDVKPEAIRGREEQHPIAKGVGEAAGLVGSAITGTGEGALLSEAGEAATKLTGLANPTSYVSRVGSGIVRNAAEMAVLQGSDEIAKKTINDPQATAESAISNMGLAAALGGAGGAFISGVASPLWKATVGSKLEGSLKALGDRLGGVEGNVPKTTASELEQATGIPLNQEFKSVIDEAPGAMERHSGLSQNDTYIAKSYQKNLNELHDNLAGKAIETLGRDPESIERTPELDKYSRGREIGETLAKEFEPQVKEINTRYDKINDEFKNTPISIEDKNSIIDQIAQKSIDQGWHKSESEAEVKLAQRISEKMSQQDTLADLKKFITNLRDSNPYGSPTYQASKDIRQILTQNQEKILSDNIAKSGGDAENKLKDYSALKQDYSTLMNRFDGLNEHLHVGRYDGPQSFLQSLKEMSSAHGERVLDRTLGGKNANILDILKDFPQTLDKVKQYHTDKLISEAISKAQPGTRINVNNMLKKFSELSPQVKDLLASSDKQQVLKSVDEVLERMKDPTHNFSNTARTLKKITTDTPTALSLISALMGHAELGIVNLLGKVGLHEGKDAIRLGMLKWAGSNQPVKAEGFKAMVNYLDHTYKGELVIQKAAQNLFKPGSQVLSSALIPTAAELTGLDKIVAKNQDNPQNIFKTNGDVGHYMPEHQQAISQTTAQAVQYLAQMKPMPHKNGPLDSTTMPSPMEEARYKRALEIAQQPAIVMQHIREGTIQISDLKDLKAMYPSLYSNMSQQITNAMIAHKSDTTQVIPYKTRIGISLFLMQPLDSSMAPQSIQAAQSVRAPAQQPNQGTQKPKKGSPSKLGNKSVGMYKTPNQEAEQDKADRN